jgi:hypothetical protein
LFVSATVSRSPAPLRLAGAEAVLKLRALIDNGDYPDVLTDKRGQVTHL